MNSIFLDSSFRYILEEIILELDSKDVGRLSLTCKTLYDFIGTSEIWTKIAKRNFNRQQFKFVPVLQYVTQEIEEHSDYISMHNDLLFVHMGEGNFELHQILKNGPIQKLILLKKIDANEFFNVTEIEERYDPIVKCKFQFSKSGRYIVIALTIFEQHKATFHLKQVQLNIARVEDLINSTNNDKKEKRIWATIPLEMEIGALHFDDSNEDLNFVGIKREDSKITQYECTIESVDHPSYLLKKSIFRLRNEIPSNLEQSKWRH